MKNSIKKIKKKQNSIKNSKIEYKINCQNNNNIYNRKKNINH